MSEAPAAVQEILEGFSPEVREIALSLRDLVLRAMPDALERPDSKDRLIFYGFGPKMADLVCVIMLYRAHTNLGFVEGALLPDPDGLLTGTGKRARHVRVASLAAVESAALDALLETAVRRHKGI